MKILLTGATGFIGSQVLRPLCARGYDVRALRRQGSKMDLVGDLPKQPEWFEGDITDIVAMEDAFDGITHVMHCAAKVSFHPRDTGIMNRINVEGTANLVNLSLEYGIQRFIHVSSIAALGRTKNGAHLDESSKWEASKLNTRYATSKYLGEQEVWRAHAEGLTVAIVNPAMVIGPGHFHENTGRMFQQIKDGLKFCPIGASGFVDVRDVARFMVLLLESDIDGQRFVLSGENLSYRDFFGKIAQNMGVKPPGITVTPFLAEIAWRVEWLKEKILGAEPLVTRESARSSVSRFTYGNQKSLKAFPEFQYMPVDKTIADTVAVMPR